MIDTIFLIREQAQVLRPFRLFGLNSLQHIFTLILFQNKQIFVWMLTNSRTMPILFCLFHSTLQRHFV